MAGEHPGPLEALGKPPGWSHPRQMRDWLRKIPQKERIAAAVDRELQKEVVRINAVGFNHDAPKIVGELTTGRVFKMSSDKIEAFDPSLDPFEFPTFETKPMNSNRTGLRDSLASLKERAAQSRQKSLEVGEKIALAFKRQEEATESLNKYADEVTREADDVLAELGQFGNGSPE